MSAPSSRATRVFALTHSQQRVMLAGLLSPGTADHHVVHAVALPDGIGVAEVVRAAAAVVARHPMLVTAFETGERGVLVQRPGVSVDPRELVDPVPFEGPADAPVAELTRAAADDWWREPFDESLPLPRMRLVARADGARVLCVATHHVVCDGWSARLVDRDLLAACGGAPGDAPEVAFAEYVAYERAELDAWRAADLHFWKSALGDFTPVLPAWETSEDVRRVEHAVAVPAVELRAFDGLSRRACLAALVALAAEFLARPLDANRVCLGTIASGRFNPQFRDIVGCFVNPVAIPVELRPGELRAERVARLTDVVGQCLAHGRTPYDEVVRHVPSDRGRQWFAVLVSLNDWTNARPGTPSPLVLTAPTTSSGLMLDATRETREQFVIRGRWPETLLTEDEGRALVEALVAAAREPLD